MPQPVWVRAEIAKLDYHRGNAYLDLSERDDDGTIVAQCRAMIWSQSAGAIEAKFMAATGEKLKKDIKVLCPAKVQLHQYYGLSLHIEDIDPAFTLGDLAARLAIIRQKLEEQGIARRNQALAKPTEFLRVAIISPKSSAGLGDFRREADQLQAHGICQFQYFTASFQGPETSGSMRQAIREAYAVHQESAFDALAIIRGGGSATDLAWLNDYQLARWVCRVPIPVFTGIGHKQDNTILDEVAHTRFDTPSKVILHIVGTVWNNAVEAMESMKRIHEQVRQLHVEESNAVASHAEAIAQGARALIERRSTECVAFRRIVELSLAPRLREWHSRVERGQQSIGRDAATRLAQVTKLSPRNQDFRRFSAKVLTTFQCPLV
jgi:exodeoxyribonuclease VII large subunit